MSIEENRKRIDEIDQQIITLLRLRAQECLEIGREKTRLGLPVYDPQREAQLLRRLATGDLEPLDAHAVSAIYAEILSTGRALQKPLSVAFLGPEHTFSHQAARQRFGSATRFLPQPEMVDVFNIVERKEADLGIVPIENSIHGVETRTLDCFVESPLQICEELYVDIHIALLCKGDLSGIKRVHSHPQPLAQCRQWLREHLPHAELIPHASTTAAAAAAQTPADAALASESAAEPYELNVLAADVQDQPGNRTRFFVIGDITTEPSGNDKTSVLFTTRHQAGALYASLAPFSAHQISLTFIQSRPAPAKLEGPYIFYADFVGHQGELPVKEALRELREKCRTLKVLGSYQSGISS